jgi:hypothetical protein
MPVCTSHILEEHFKIVKFLNVYKTKNNSVKKWSVLQTAIIVRTLVEQINPHSQNFSKSSSWTRKIILTYV